MAVNYQKQLEETLCAITAAQKVPSLPEQPKLLLHSCCGPCSSAVLEYLSGHFDITVLYYNPNIWPPEEFNKRTDTQRQLIARMNTANPVKLIVAEYRPEVFDNAVRGYESAPEGGERCLKCFALRQEASARFARDNGFDYFTTTLSVSPHKDAAALNEIGRELEAIYGVKYLYADFKKKNGYKRSIELSKQYGLYRQQYCGCKYSLGYDPIKNTAPEA